jgi:hypothetical protein
VPTKLTVAKIRTLKNFVQGLKIALQVNDLENPKILVEKLIVLLL